ncbi:phage head closure protein [Acinetobacter sp. CFCC 10889]|uniref:phage head closure protein n=1 Tax=Acinetobacter sp. CFCC 10889 TaxID=1775557 RepID=UPI000DD0E001|nr:phage head closure protein [Acinetobacter sp. CFCC 10889]
MPVNAGELRHRVTIQHFVEQRDEYNNLLDKSWTEYKKLWAKVEFLSVKDTLTAKVAGSETTARLKIRKRTDITTEMRVLWKGQIFQIVSPPKPDNENGEIYVTFELKLLE